MSQETCKSTVTIPLKEYNHLMDCKRAIEKIENSKGLLFKDFSVYGGRGYAYIVYTADEALLKLQEIFKENEASINKKDEILRIERRKLEKIGSEIYSGSCLTKKLRSRIRSIIHPGV